MDIRGTTSPSLLLILIGRPEFWLNIFLHFFFPGQHFINVTWDRVYLAYALMIGAELNFRSIFKSSMRKAQVHRGRKYTFGGLITKLCKCIRVPEEALDYFPHIEGPQYNVTNIKGLVVSEGPMLTTTERAHRDMLIMGRMYGLKMLHHKTGGRPSTQEELDEVEAHYLLNAYANAVLGIDPQFFELMEDDVSIDPKNAREASDVDEDEIEEEHPVGGGRTNSTSHGGR